jgi:polysaccharide transporter, PST family
LTELEGNGVRDGESVEWLRPRARENLRGRAAKGVFWTATSNWVDQLTRLLVFAILSRLLEPEAFGLVALAWVFIGFTDVLAEQGLGDALVQRRRLESTHLDTAFWMSMALGLLSGILLAALAVPIAGWLGQDQLALVLVALSFAIPLGSCSLVQRSILRREMDFRALALRTLVGIGIGSVVGVAAAFMGFGVWSLVAQRLVTQIASAAVLWRVARWRPHLNFGYAHFRELFRFGKHVVGFRLLNYFNSNADNFLVGAVLGPVSLGFYTVGYRILRLVIQLTSNLIDSVAFPLYSRLQDKPGRFVRAYYKSSSFAALVAFPVFVSTLVMAPQLTSVLFGSKWDESVPVMRVLAIVGIVRAVTYLNSSTITALGKPSWRVIIVGITTVLNAIAFVAAVRHGIVAVAVAAVVVGYLVTPISYWAVNRLAPINLMEYLRSIRGPAVASVFLAGTMVGLQYVLGNANELLTLIVVSSAGGLVYIATIQILARPLADEARDLARRALPRAGVPRPVRLLARR